MKLSLSAEQVRKLNRIIAIAQQLVAEITLAQQLGIREGKIRIRRSGKELMRFRHMLKMERKKGIPVAKLAAKHGVSTAYIYMFATKTK